MHTERRWLISSPVMGAVIGLEVLVYILAPSDAPERLILLGVTLALLTMHVRVRVDDDGVAPFFFPIYGKRVPFAQIDSVEVIDYRWTKFGGWGLRLGDGALAYSVWEKRAVRIHKAGRDVVIGSKDPERLAEAIRGHLALRT